jgi:hypothetical protein
LLLLAFLVVIPEGDLLLPLPLSPLLPLPHPLCVVILTLSVVEWGSTPVFVVALAVAVARSSHPKNKSQKRGKFKKIKTWCLRTSERTSITTTPPHNHHVFSPQN